MTPLIGVGGLALSVAMLVAGAGLVAARTASTRVERFWVGLLVVQIELSIVAVTCSLLKVLEARAVFAAQAVLLGVLVLATRTIGGPRYAPTPRQKPPGGTSNLGSRGTQGSDRIALALVVALAVVLLTSGLRQLASPLTGFDDRMYHASRVAYWMQYGTIFFPDTHNQRQTVFPFGAELWFAWPLLFVKHEMAGRLGFWAGLPLGAIAVGTVARAIGLSRTARLAAVLLYAATPIVLLHATSLKSDLWLPIFLLGSAYFVVREPLPGESVWRSQFLAGACLALAMSVKMTAVALAPGLLVAAILKTGGANRGRAIGALGAGLVTGIVLSGFMVLLVRNAVAHGHPFGPRAMNHVHQADLSPRQLYVHAVRTPLALLELPMVPTARLRDGLERAGQMVARMTAADTPLPLEGAAAWPGRFSFSMARRAVGYSLGGLLWLPCLALVLAFAARDFARSWPKPKLSQVSVLAICQVPLLLGTVFLARWMAGAGSTRFWLGGYALSVPVTVFVLGQLSRRWRWTRWPIAIALTWTVGVALADESWRLVQAVRHPLRPLETDEPYQNILPHLPPGARILLVAHQDTRDYPLFNPSMGYVNQVFSWGRGPFEAGRADALIEEQRITHVLIDNDREVEFHWAGRLRTAPMVKWLCDRPNFRELALYSRPMRLFERTSRASTGPEGHPWPRSGSEGPTACARESPSAEVSVNGTRLRPSETAMVGFEVGNPAFGTPADLYPGMILPDGHTTVLFTSVGGLGAVADLAAPQSLEPTQAAPPGFNLNRPAFLAYTFPTVGSQTGVYVVFAALVRQGALADNHIDPGDVLAIETKTLAYQP